MSFATGEQSLPVDVRVTDNPSSLAFQFDRTIEIGPRSRAVLLACAQELATSARPLTDRLQSAKASALHDIQTLDEDREAARVCIFVLCDIVAHGWTVNVSSGEVWVSPPAPSERQQEEKARVRDSHLIERDRQLRQPATLAFLRRMER